MSSSAPQLSPPDPAIIPLDPAESFSPKPLIAEILRTHFCIPGSIFLVEGIDSDIPAGKTRRAVRLLLGDGELCVQALLAPEMHGFVDGGQVYAGCYVRVNAFEARWLYPDSDGDGEGEDEVSAGDERRRAVVAGKRPSRRTMVYLLLEDLVTVGWNTVYLELLKDQALTDEGEVRDVHERETDPGQGSAHHFVSADSHSEHLRDERSKDEAPQFDHHPPPQRLNRPFSATGTAKARDKDTSTPANVDDFSDDSDFETMVVSIEKATQRRRQAASGVDAHRTNTTTSHNHHWISNDLTKPMKITPLRAVPNLPYKQNWMINVLAVVVSISDVEPSHLPPYAQRTARLADQSTAKHVLLTVFLDPEEFCPAVGSVVLLLGVKNHRFDGGSLKKYASDRPGNGAPWWVEDPRELEWCDVESLREWWDVRGG